MSGFDTGTLTLSGVSILDALVPANPIVPPNPIRLLSAQFDDDTRFLAAALDGYQPQDPYCPVAAAAYNSALSVVTSDGDLFWSAMDGLVANGCNARVVVDFQTNKIVSFEPVAGP